MRIEFDPGKDVANMARHGVSLRLAESLEWDCFWQRKMIVRIMANCV